MKPPAIKYTWLRIVLYLIAVIAASAVGMIAGFLVVIPVIGGNIIELAQDIAGLIDRIGPFYFGLINLFSAGALLLTVWLFRRFIDRRDLADLGFTLKGYGRDLLAGLSWGTIRITAGFAALWLNGNLRVIAVHIDTGQLLGYLFFFAIVAFNEEVMIRGYVLTNLLEKTGKYTALVLSALIFMIMHLGNENLSLIALINLFLAGIILGVYYIHKRNLWFSIGMHLTWNFFQGPVYGFEVSGMSIQGMIRQELSGNDWLTGGAFGLEGSVVTVVVVLAAAFLIDRRYRNQSFAEGKTYETVT